MILMVKKSISRYFRREFPMMICESNQQLRDLRCNVNKNLSHSHCIWERWSSLLMMPSIFVVTQNDMIIKNGIWGENSNFPSTSLHMNFKVELVCSFALYIWDCGAYEEERIKVSDQSFMMKDRTFMAHKYNYLTLLGFETGKRRSQFFLSFTLGIVLWDFSQNNEDNMSQSTG